jgi:hypothetical protein
VAAIFVLSRLVFHYAGIRFDATPLDWYWQYVDPQLLKDRLLESTYYLHSQPPLFNLFVGVVLKAAGGHETVAFMLAYKAMGLVLALSMFSLMRRLKIRTYFALALTTAFIVSPSTIAYESWLFYSYPLAAILCLAGLVLHRYMASGRPATGMLFFGLLAFAVLMRSMFHLIYLVGFVLLVLYFRRYEWRRVLLAALIPLAVVVLLYAKNAVLFGTFGSSSWFGMSLAKMTTFKIPADERERLVEEGRISKISLIRPFRDITEYERYVPLPEKTGVPVLDEERKSSGHPKFNSNYNNLIFIDVADHYRRDALVVLRAYPGAYLKTVVASLSIFFFPTSDYSFLEGNLSHIRSLNAFYNRVVYGQFLVTGPRGWRDQTYTDWRRVERVGFFLVAGFVVFLVCLLRRIRTSSSDPPVKTTLIFIYFTVLYVIVVSSLVEIGENNRFRFIIDPLFLVGLGVCLNGLISRLSKGAKERRDETLG